VCYNPAMIDIKKWRQERGWSRERLARELGVAAYTVWRWEEDGVKPIPAHQEKLDALAKQVVTQ